MGQRVYRREDYLEKIRGFYHSDIIKVITGIRRCGKSCILLSIIQELKESGVEDSDIIYINLDQRGYRSISTPDELERVIDAKIGVSEQQYLFIDEIQNVKDYERLIEGYRLEGMSIFITGSNSYLLSGELMTHLTGRYLEFEIHTLNFHEFLEMKHFLGKPIRSAYEEFEEYLNFGGFPQTLLMDDPREKERYVREVVEQIIVKDIKKRNKIRDMRIFDRVATYIINNFGSTTTLKNIAAALKQNEGVTVRPERVRKYIDMLIAGKILYRCERFDLKSRRSLKGEEKYYLADIGIYRARNVNAAVNYGPLLENLVYLYLRSKDHLISIGKLGKLECDFICRKGPFEYSYVQVSRTIAEKSTEDREYRPLEALHDNYPKYVLTMDPLLQKRNGIVHQNLVRLMERNEDL